METKNRSGHINTLKAVTLSLGIATLISVYGSDIGAFLRGGKRGPYIEPVLVSERAKTDVVKGKGTPQGYTVFCPEKTTDELDLLGDVQKQIRRIPFAETISYSQSLDYNIGNLIRAYNDPKIAINSIADQYDYIVSTRNAIANFAVTMEDGREGSFDLNDSGQRREYFDTIDELYGEIWRVDLAFGHNQAAANDWSHIRHNSIARRSWSNVDDGKNSVKVNTKGIRR
jgi:hypothetical protein